MSVISRVCRVRVSTPLSPTIRASTCDCEARVAVPLALHCIAVGAGLTPLGPVPG